jgi:peptide/nickel transport system substrate-binding protein
MGRLATLCLVFAVVIAACTSTSGSRAATTVAMTTIPPTTMVTTPTEPPDGYGGEVIIGASLPVTTLNPFSENAPLSANLAGQAVWATTYDILPDSWERVPDIITSLPTRTPGGIEIAEDGSMTVRYQVEQNAVWSDGIPITGADIAFTAEKMAALALGGSQNIDPIMASVIATSSLDRIARITFSEASFAFEDALWVVLPSHAIDEATDLGKADGFVWPSGGPFVVAQSQEPRSLSLERNLNYWKTTANGDQLPYLERLTFASGEAVDMFSNRRVDVFVVSAGVDAVDVIPEEAEVQVAQSPLVEQLTFQFAESRDAANPESNNDSRDYRTAIAYSLDREGIVDEAGVLWSPETPGMLVAKGPSAWDIYPYNASEGSTLIDAVADVDDSILGSPKAVLTTTSELDDRIRMGDALVGNFAGIGVDLGTKYLESLIFFGEQLGTGSFDIGMWAWPSNGGYGSQLLLMEHFDVESADNLGNWGVGDSASDGSAAYSELVAEARSTTDAARFEEIIGSAETLLAEYLPVIPLFRRSSVTAFWADRLTGVVHNGSRSDLTWNVGTWQRPGE